MEMRTQVDDVGQRAKALYESRIRPLVETEHRGKYLVVDVESGDYEVDDKLIDASDRAVAKHPHGRFFLMRIGHSALGRIGFGLTGQ